jgi:hypothetical protein
MIKKVASYQASDGTLHANQVDALRHEYHIELQAVLNKASNKGNFTPSEVTTILQNNTDYFMEVMRKYKEEFRRATLKEKIQILVAGQPQN